MEGVGRGVVGLVAAGLSVYVSFEVYNKCTQDTPKGYVMDPLWSSTSSLDPADGTSTAAGTLAADGTSAAAGASAVETKKKKLEMEERNNMERFQIGEFFKSFQERCQDSKITMPDDDAVEENLEHVEKFVKSWVEKKLKPTFDREYDNAVPPLTDEDANDFATGLGPYAEHYASFLADVTKKYNEKVFSFLSTNQGRFTEIAQNGQTFSFQTKNQGRFNESNRRYPPRNGSKKARGP